MKKVLITGCSNPLFWYSDFIGTELEVEKISSNGHAILNAEQKIKATGKKSIILSTSILKGDFSEVVKIKTENQLNKFRIRIFDVIYNKDYKDLAGMEFDVFYYQEKLHSNVDITIQHPLTGNSVVIRPGDWMEVNAPKNPPHKEENILPKIEEKLGLGKEISSEDRNKMLCEELRNIFDKYDKEGGLIGFIAFGKDIKELGPKTSEKVLELKKDLSAAGYTNFQNYAKNPEHLFILEPEQKPINGISEETGKKMADAFRDLKNSFSDSWALIGNKIYQDRNWEEFQKWRLPALKKAKEEFDQVDKFLGSERRATSIIKNEIVKEYGESFYKNYGKYISPSCRSGKTLYFQRLSDDIKTFYRDFRFEPGEKRPLDKPIDFKGLGSIRFGVDTAGHDKDKTVISTIKINNGRIEILDVFNLEVKFAISTIQEITELYQKSCKARNYIDGKIWFDSEDPNYTKFKDIAKKSYLNGLNMVYGIDFSLVTEDRIMVVFAHDEKKFYVEKPPLGIVPAKMVLDMFLKLSGEESLVPFFREMRKRMKAVKKAIARYKAAGFPVPKIWFEELESMGKQANYRKTYLAFLRSNEGI